MPKYVDAFVVPIPKKNVAAYKKMAELGRKVWMEHGALDYKECIAEDMTAPWAMTFPKGIKARSSETVVFSWIVYKSRKHRDGVNKAVMKDPRLTAGMDQKKMPFDVKRMLYGGFEVLVDA